jgi:peptide chain release factor 1
MFDKLRQLEERYADLSRRLSDPQVIAQTAEYARTAKAAAELSEVVQKFGVYKDVLQRISEAKHILAEDDDREMREMAQAEVDALTARQARLEDDLRTLLLPRDPNDDRNVFVARAARKPRCSPRISRACTRSTRSARSGRSR